MSKIKKRISNEHVRKMIEILKKADYDGELVEDIINELDEGELLAGDRGGRKTGKRFEGSDGTCYFQPLAFKKSKRKDANNTITRAFVNMQEEYTNLALPIFEGLQIKYMVDPTK
jgi:hypothetical protein|tara:strand:- start:1793 stop:2137 length:345 start_codon:yes stop_codon:yes gene_type:complete